MTLLRRRLTNRLKQVNDVALELLDLFTFLGDFQVDALRTDIRAVEGASFVVRAGHRLDCTSV